MSKYKILKDNLKNVVGEEFERTLPIIAEEYEAKIRRQAAEITRLLAENKELKKDLEYYHTGTDTCDIESARAEGQNEAWELARKCMLMTDQEREAIFGSGHNALYGVLTYFEYKHAAAKVAEWGKDEIKVGDIVTNRVNDKNLCVTCISTDKKYYSGVDRYGTLYYMLSEEMINKTGRHIDIDSFLKQIGEE